jgi:hypothetical protein
MKTKKTILTLCIAALLPILAVSCGEKKEQSASDRVLDFANRLVKVIDEFEKARTQVLQVINTSAVNMEKYLSSSMSTKEKADKYEKDWKKLASEIKAMETKFNMINNSSNAYFNKLYALNESISNDDLRKKEYDKNVALRRSWNKVYQNAESDVSKIRTVLEEGNDFHKVLLASVMRSKIADNISQMKDISSRARKIIKELSRFSVEGKKILQGGFTSQSSSNTKESDEPKGNNKKNQGSSGEQPEPKPNVNNDGPLTEVVVDEVNASSYFSADDFVYKPANVIDNNLKTWWSPKRNDFSSNWLQVTFNASETIRGIEIHGGSHYPNYPNYGDIYRKNHRVKTAVLEFSDGSSETIRLKDMDAVQEFKFSPRNTRYVILKIKTWYPTEKWKDLCVSHFKVFK